MKKIFLSYRRGDVPGYVARLEDELERVFGPDRVFRDVEDIAGGAEWKRVLDENLERSAALVLVIGPRWAQIWTERNADPVNYVALELQRARELGVPVVPVTLNHAAIPRELDLGEVAWLRDRQFYDISDVQNRWSNDVRGLVDTLAALPGVGVPVGDAGGASHPAARGKGSGRLIGVGIAAVVLVLAGLALMQFPKAPDPDEPTVTREVTVDRPVQPVPSVADSPDPVPATPPRETRPVALSVPDISGTWVSRKDGTSYHVEQRDDGSFNVTSPGYGTGEGQFIANMPRKFRIEMHGIGRGEFAVSNSDDSAIGWLLNYETQAKEYDTLQRVE
ncbi:MAG: toll/interleukin-1 receptor domain-containing protein [Gammaproteobacteria bacterium]|nr:toll/interleukin-1 receptor domain-containing protein [Gammaproteobacteria bacterium]